MLHVAAALTRFGCTWLLMIWSICSISFVSAATCSCLFCFCSIMLCMFLSSWEISRAMKRGSPRISCLILSCIVRACRIISNRRHGQHMLRVLGSSSLPAQQLALRYIAGCGVGWLKAVETVCDASTSCMCEHSEPGSAS